MSIADELAKLEDLRSRGALTEAEFAQAKAALLSGGAAAPDAQLGQHLSEQLAEVKYQNELARLDREWEMERQNYYLTDRYGRRQLPTPGMGIAVAVIGGGFGLLWTVFAAAITGSAPDEGPFSVVKVIFPLFGVLFIVIAIGYGIYAYNRARAYQRAYQAYQARRRNVHPDAG